MNPTKLTDTHTHYAHRRFDCGRDEILNTLIDNDIEAVVEAAIDFASNQKMKKLCEKYSHVYMAVGCHPNCIEEMDDDKYQQIVELTKYDKVIAIGEIGLDYGRNKSKEQVRIQKEWFRKFVELAIEKHKPLVIHCREAYDDTIDILQEYKLMECPGVVHCFSGDIEQAIRLIDMGFYIGVNGMFTNMDVDSDVCKALKSVPIERIVFETDSPYLIPAGVKGKRNTSANLSIVVEKFADLRGESTDYIRQVVRSNVNTLYTSISSIL